MSRRTPVSVDLPGLTGFDAARPAAACWRRCKRRDAGLSPELAVLVAIQIAVVVAGAAVLAVLW